MLLPSALPLCVYFYVLITKFKYSRVAALIKQKSMLKAFSSFQALGNPRGSGRAWAWGRRGAGPGCARSTSLRRPRGGHRWHAPAETPVPRPGCSAAWTADPHPGERLRAGWDLGRGLVFGRETIHPDGWMRWGRFRLCGGSCCYFRQRAKRAVLFFRPCLWNCLL